MGTVYVLEGFSGYHRVYDFSRYFFQVYSSLELAQRAAAQWDSRQPEDCEEYWSKISEHPVHAQDFFAPVGERPDCV